MGNKDGTLNQKYFSNHTKETAMNWADIELLQLYEGIYKFGVDSVEKWIKIQSEFLPQRDFIEVRLKLSQLFGIQDLSKYKGRSFKSEKEISDEFEKNKKEAIKNKTWNEQSDVALKAEIAGLNEHDLKNLNQKELAEWKKYIYDNPTYIYRVNKKNKKSKKSTKSTNNKSGKSVPKKQKNTIDTMLKKQAEKANDQQKKKEINDMEQDKEKEDKEDKNKNKNTKPKPKKKQNKKKNKKPTKKQLLPLMPEDSEDEEMLCVE